MWWLYLLLSATFAHGASEQNIGVSSHGLDIQPWSDMPETNQSNLIKLFEKMSRKFLESFAAAYDHGHVRHKRQARTLPNATLLADTDEVYRLQSVNPLFKMCLPAREIKFINVEDTTYGVCVSTPTYFTEATVYVGYFTADTWNVIAHWGVENPEGVSLLYKGGLLYILVPESNRADGIWLTKVNLTSHEFMKYYRSSNKYPTAVTLWKMNHDEKHYFAVANGNKDAEDLSSTVHIFNWDDTYFDRASIVHGHDVRHIEPFYIHGDPYLAVANYRKSEYDFSVDSEIFKYDFQDQDWVSFQTIRTYGALQWKAFSLGAGTGQEFYLAVANSAQHDPNMKVMSVIYKFVDIFVPVQCLNAPGATAIATYNDESKFLMAISSYEGVKFYQYDGWRFVLANIQFTQLTMSIGVRALTFHQMSDSKIVLAVSNSNPQFSNEVAIYEISFAGEKHLEPWYEMNVNWCFNQRELLESSGELLPGLKDVFYVDQKEPIVINGDLHFEKSVNAAKLTTPSLHVLNSGQIYDNSVLLRLKMLNEKLERAKNRIDVIDKALEKALKLTGAHQNVTANYEFKNVTFLCDSRLCHFNNIHTTFLNGDDVRDFKNNLIFLDEDTVIDAQISAERISAVEINVNGLVNGVDMSTVVTKHGNFNISGLKEFRQTVHAEDIEVKGLVDGIKFTRDTILLSSGHQKITGNVTFDDVQTSWINVRDYVNSVNLTNFYNEVVRTSGTYTIRGQKTFGDIMVDDLRMIPGSLINGVNLDDLYSNALWTYGDQTITAPLTFSSVSMERSFTVDGTINGISIPGPQILFVNQNATVTAPQVFEESVYMRRLRVRQSINGIGVDQNTGELDILRKGVEQTITGQKTFNEVVLSADSWVEGTINGVDIEKLHNNSLRSDTPIDMERTWTFNNLRVEGPLRVLGTVSGMDLAEVYDRALKLNESSTSTFTFRAPVTIRNLQTDDINGINVRRDLVLVNEPQEITGRKTFKVITLEDNSHITGLVNNYNLSFLNDVLLRFGNQVISSKKVIRGNVKVNNLILNGRLNGIKFDEVVTLNNANEVTGQKTFSNVTFKELVVEHLTIDGLVNGVNVVEMMKDTMTYDGVQTVTGVKTINGIIRLSPGSNLRTADLNGVDVKALYDDAAIHGKDQTIYGKKVFLEQVSFEHLNVTGSIDGVTDWDMRENWLLKDKQQTVYGDVIFQNVTAGDITVNGLVNGVNLIHLNRTIVKVNEPGTIAGPIIFNGKVTSNADVTMTGKIQGLDLAEQAVLRNADDVVITGRKTFHGDIIVDGDLYIQGLLNGVSVQDLCNNTIFLNQYQSLDNLVIKGNVSLLEATVGGMFGGVNLLALQESITAVEEATFFDGLKTFETLTIEGSLTVLGKFGGIDVGDLSQNYMSRSRPQTITAEHHFEELSIKGDLTVTNLNSADGEISGINLASLDKRILKTTGEQTITAPHNFSHVVFEDDVLVLGKVSGVEIPDGLMRRNRTNYIKSKKIFQQPVTVLGDLNFEKGKRIQGVDISAWFASAVLKDGHYEIKGHKTFGNVDMTDVTVKGLVDGIKVDEDSILLKNKDQVIKGQKRIINSVNIEGSLTVAGKINDIDILDLDKRAVRKDRNVTITGIKTFKRPLTIKHLEAELVDGVDVTSLQSLANTSLDFDYMRQRLNEMDDFLREMKVSFDNQAVLLQYYELYQVVDMPAAHSWLYVPTVSNEFLLLSDDTRGNACTSIRIFRHNDMREKFELQKLELISSPALTMKYLKAWGWTFLVVVNNEPNAACTLQNSILENHTGGAIYIYDEMTSHFQPYQRLDTFSNVDVAAFTDTQSCLVVLEMSNVVVFCATEKLHNFNFHETISHTKGGRKVSITKSRGRVLMAILGVNVLEPYKQVVDVYIWDNVNTTFGSPIQAIPTHYVESVLLMSRPDSEDTFLLITEGSVRKINNLPRLLIYKYENSQFHKLQEIADHGELDSVILPSGQFAFFVLNRETGQINVYVHTGVSGFEKFDTITGIGSLRMHVFTRNHVDGETNHHIAIAGSRGMRNTWDDPGYPKILKSKMKGRKFLKQTY